MKKITVLLLSAIVFFSACNDTEDKERESTKKAITDTAPDIPATDGLIILNGGDDMKFDLSEIRVREGAMVRLTLYHTGKAPKTAMGHNFILLKAGVSLDAFITKALEAKDNDYIPEDGSDIIVHTRLLGGGESDTIEFTAPAKGSYQFLCSFPGHAAMMNGQFIVE